MTFAEINKKFPMDREEMTIDQQIEFVSDCYEAYEQEGFSPVFWTPYDQYANRIGQLFSVVRRIGHEENDISILPMWEICFNDGITTLAYPEEIVLNEMVSNGYKEN